jgi:UDP-N-acetyl-D-glucosamine dehydrogenase
MGEVTLKPASILAAKIQDRSAVVGVIGLGYVGLPLVLVFEGAGFPVIGFDVDPKKPAALNQGVSYIKHIGPERLAAAIERGRIQATTDFDRLAECDAILICVPTPLGKHREPDISYIQKTGEEIAKRLRPGQLINLESTTYPGTTREELLPRLEARALKAGHDFFLAFSPEREDPGNPKYHTKNIPKVVGGYDDASLGLAVALYAAAVDHVIPVSSLEVAESTKLLENIFRAVNIALVNELKIIFDRMGIDIWEVLDAASTKPFGFMRFNPGPGWGGHCIPVDPFYLAWKAKEFGCTAKFIELAGEINVKMPEYVVEKLTLALNGRGKAVKGAKILLLGIAYKKDIDDTRESPAFEIMDLLHHLGAEVAYHDPHISEIGLARRHPDNRGLRSVPLNAETLAAQDAVLLVTDHSNVDYELVAREASLVMDTRGVFRQASWDFVGA